MWYMATFQTKKQPHINRSIHLGTMMSQTDKQIHRYTDTLSFALRSKIKNKYKYIFLSVKNFDQVIPINIRSKVKNDKSKVAYQSRERVIKQVARMRLTATGGLQFHTHEAHSVKRFYHKSLCRTPYFIIFEREMTFTIADISFCCHELWDLLLAVQTKGSVVYIKIFKIRFNFTRKIVIKFQKDFLFNNHS